MASGRSGKAYRQLPDIREGLPLHPDNLEGLLTTPGYPGGPPDHYRTIEIAFQPFPDIRNASIPISVIWEGLSITP